MLQRSSTIWTKLEASRFKRRRTGPTLQKVRRSRSCRNKVKFALRNEKWARRAFDGWVVAAPLPHRDEEDAKHIVILHQRRWRLANRAHRCFFFQHRAYLLRYSTEEKKEHHRFDISSPQQVPLSLILYSHKGGCILIAIIPTLHTNIPNFSSSLVVAAL